MKLIERVGNLIGNDPTAFDVRSAEKARTLNVGHLFVGVWLSCGSAPVWASPPFQTDDPEPVALHHYEFYVATQQTLTSSERSGTLPHFEFNYGVAPDAQLHVIAPFAFNSPTGDTARIR